ncbi:SEC-C domain-containing protein [Flavobacterium sp.]|uniref:SEC-C domain-containing protein n=1 Tax=Flavobacterium sp. TaxID=239 RepID=UPI002B4AB613|nr:SEC-C domain-containing protein [Flavobacterium sp.]HLP64257.1 SEC-C domain-containing protein [Flavobacterium sp.]
MNVKRTAYCPCGSGKIYKKCCANIPKKDRVFEDELVNYIRNSNAIRLLEFVSHLQLIPENSTKIIRLERIQHKIIENLHNKNFHIDNDYNVFKKIVDKYYPDDYNEDPSESCFSENLMFFNGNNIVFPGITSNATEVNQLIINTVYHRENDISQDCKNHINIGCDFSLQVHDNIAKKLNIKRYMFIDDYRGKITFPQKHEMDKHIGLFTFSKIEIEQRASEMNLKFNPILDFVINQEALKNVKPHDTEFLKHPFIDFDDNYYLALPSSQMYSLNVFLKERFVQYNKVDEFKRALTAISKGEGELVFTKMGWKHAMNYQKLIDAEFEVWKFDEDKYAIVNYIIGSDNLGKTQKIENFIDENGGDNQFMVITIHSPFDLESPYGVRQEIVKNAKYQMIVGLQDLKRAMVIWKLKQLDLWKYLKAKERAESKNLNLSPAFSLLTYMSYYKRNENSFFHSDDKKVDYLHFTFDIQGNKVIESLQKEDRHLALIFTDDGLMYTPVSKYDVLAHAPIYFSDTVVNGELKLIIEKYEFPIWIVNNIAYDWECKNFLDAIAYWLNEFSPTLNSFFIGLPNMPLTISISLDEGFNNYTSEDFLKNKKSKVNFQFTLNEKINQLSILIPSVLNNLIKENNNNGEKMLMQTVLKGLTELINENFNVKIEVDIQNIIDKHMSSEMAKMIVAGNTAENIKLDNRFIPSRTFFLDKADTSIVLEEMVEWMQVDIPEKIQTRKEKIDVCVFGINTLIEKVREIISKFDSISLLEFVALRNEVLLNGTSFKKIRTVTFYECFKNYLDTLNEFVEEDAKNIRTGLCLRCLIEFIVAEPHYGNSVPNNDDVDMLVALVDEIIFLGTTKDILFFELDDPEMGKLPSGRLGIQKDYFSKLNEFSLEHKKDEHFEYTESFTFTKIMDDNLQEDEQYYEKVDEIFNIEFGIGIFKIKVLLDELAKYCFEEKKSILTIKEKDFLKLLKSEFKLTIAETESLINNFILNSRGNISIPPKGYDYTDIFPWRYNRSLSYLLRPIIKIKNVEGSNMFILSARHLAAASENFMAVFFDGSLKVNKDLKKINSLLAERNNIKGKHFRNEVCNWMKDYTSLEVVPYEFKIPVKGNEKNYGDVDILAFDKTKKIIYSIECKNTKQAKIIYEFQRDAKNYINKQLPKHITRSIWLEKNLAFLGSRFQYDFLEFRVESLLISSYQLPVKITENIEGIKIISFNEIKRKKYFK